MTFSADESARELLEVVPLLMRTIRTEIRSHRGTDLSIPQFRTLAVLNYHPGASLSEISEHIGLTLPTMSKMIDSLVARQLVKREISAHDRRRVTLALTETGRTSFQLARAATQAFLAEQLATLSEADQALIVQVMRILRSIFSPNQEH